MKVNGHRHRAIATRTPRPYQVGRVRPPAVLATRRRGQCRRGRRLHRHDRVATFTDPGAAPSRNSSDPGGPINDHYKVDVDRLGRQHRPGPLERHDQLQQRLGEQDRPLHRHRQSHLRRGGDLHHHTPSSITRAYRPPLTDPGHRRPTRRCWPPACPSLPRRAMLNSHGVTVATFTDPGGAEPNSSDPKRRTSPDHYKVDSIDWGDSTPLDTTSGTITYSDATGHQRPIPFTVSGSHAYAHGRHLHHYHDSSITKASSPITMTTTAVIKDEHRAPPARSRLAPNR